MQTNDFQENIARSCAWPLLPPLAEFIPYLEQFQERKWLANNGSFHEQFERALCDYLGVKHISLFAIGTLS